VFKVSAFFIAHVTSSFKCKVLFFEEPEMLCFYTMTWGLQAEQFLGQVRCEKEP